MPHTYILSPPQVFKCVLPVPLLQNHRPHCYISVADYSFVFCFVLFCFFLPEKQLLAEQILTSVSYRWVN